MKDKTYRLRAFLQSGLVSDSEFLVISMWPGCRVVQRVSVRPREYEVQERSDDGSWRKVGTPWVNLNYANQFAASYSARLQEN